ncbi:hypothetical protein L6164_013280 [Bauhinia variegata]|uniref:Uncharacterized protein n=1 Tax=Bauhinia variegata TaxID=167791 RepID=A0ACB9PCX9_BAUVA|nr:hypothetical protein L6164_013280 [Bauhinia variegata]
MVVASSSSDGSTRRDESSIDASRVVYCYSGNQFGAVIFYKDSSNLGRIEHYATNSRLFMWKLKSVGKVIGGSKWLFQFLMGLNKSFGTVIGHVLLMAPLTNVNQAYSMLVHEKT